MIKEVLSKFDMIWMPLVALIIFAVCFAGFTYWTLRKENKLRYEEAGALPLSEGEKK